MAPCDGAQRRARIAARWLTWWQPLANVSGGACGPPQCRYLTVQYPLRQPTPDTSSPRPGLDAEQRRGTHVFFPSKSSASTSVTDGLHPSPRHALHVGKRAGGAVGARAVPVARQGANGARVGDAAHAVAAGITRLLARAV